MTRRRLVIIIATLVAAIVLAALTEAAITHTLRRLP